VKIGDSDSRSVDNMVSNVYVKSNHNPLHIDKALGSFCKSDNKNNKKKRDLLALGDPFRSENVNCHQL